jgi:hypothetical protein
MPDNDRTISIALGCLLILGLLYMTKVVFLGTLMFAGIWVILRRVAGFEWFAARAPIIVDLGATAGALTLLAIMGVSSTTTFLATAVAGLEVSIWVATIRARHRAEKQVGQGPH